MIREALSVLQIGFKFRPAFHLVKFIIGAVEDGLGTADVAKVLDLVYEPVIKRFHLADRLSQQEIEEVLTSGLQFFTVLRNAWDEEHDDG